ncbi:MAG: glycerol-3-phosphate acyltransferase [Acidimicrobiia bacterium]
MSDGAVVALLTPLAYLLGTFPSASIVANRKGVDIRAEGSGNPGASNTFRTLGWKAGALVFGMDAAKGALAALAGLLIAGHRGALVLGIAAILGHVAPITRPAGDGFRGGRGVATAAGVLLVLYPLIVVGAAVVWGLITWTTHKASVASITLIVAIPVAVALTGESWWVVALLAVVAVVLVARHADNLRRLARGEELGIGMDGDPGTDRTPDPTPDDENDDGENA